MLAALSWIPILGPIFQTVANAWAQHEDVALKKQQDVNLTSLAKQQDISKTDLAVIQTRAQVAIAFRDDPGVRIIRDIVMFPIGVWTGAYFYMLAFPQWSWPVNTPPETMQYIPYAVIGFLFVTAYRGNK